MKLTVACIVVGLALLIGPSVVSGNGSRTTASSAATTTFPETLPELSTIPQPLFQPSTSTTSTTSTTLIPVDQFEVIFPVTQALPYATLTWKVDYRIHGPGMLVLHITLMPVVNHADQLAGRQAAMKQAKTEALAWLAAKGAAPGTYGAVWQPAEAERL